MNGRQRVFSAVFVILGLLWLGSAVGPAGDAKPPVAGASDFAGKVIIVVYARGDAQGSTVLEKSQVKKLGDRSFIVGVGIDEWSPDRWARGITVWVPIDTVSSIMEVADVEQAKKVFGKAEK